MSIRSGLFAALAGIVLLSAGGVWYGKHRLLQSQPVGAIPIRQKEKNPLDLRPAVIAKLQQLVWVASDSLYKLRIDSLETEIASGTIVFHGVGLYPDSNAIPRLRKLGSLPDDIFKVNVGSFRITGIGLDDILHRRNIHLRALSCVSPDIVVYHQTQTKKQQQEGSQTPASALFCRVRELFDRIAVDSIVMRRGKLLNYYDGQKNVFNELSLLLKDVSVDSGAVADQNRCFFARSMRLDAGNISLGDGDYEIKIGGISVLGPEKKLILRDFDVMPIGGKEAVARRQKERSGIFTIKAPLVELEGTNWWAAVNRESLFAAQVDASRVFVDVYVDERVPAGPVIRDNFPQLKLQNLDMPVMLRKVNVAAATIWCEVQNIESGEKSKLSFDNLSMKADNVTNVAAELRVHPVSHVSAGCSFMHTTPMQADIQFWLPKQKRGAFDINLKMGALQQDVVNSFSEAMGMVKFTSGGMESANSSLHGNTDQVSGSIAVRYHDLHLVQLKKKGDELKEKNVTGKIANLLFVKDNNPSKGTLRQPSFSLRRSKESNFFSFAWEGIKLGLLKSIGVPPALSKKK